jgi:UDPglucose--hexose-1-phosphate uridylyltransferase
MVEVRVDETTGGWSVLAPRRAARPDDDRPSAASAAEGRAAGAANDRTAGTAEGSTASAAKAHTASADDDRTARPACPFCWGNEGMTPPEVLRVPAGAPDWRVRVVPNLYAAVDPRGDTVPVPPAPQSPAPQSPALFTGRHEVLVESGRHDWDLRRGDPDEVATILFAMRERCRVLAADGPAAISAFRNYGARAGASLVHPHSQLVALDHAPPGLLDRWRRAREHHDRTGGCLHDAIAAAERRDARRVVLDLGEVLVFQDRAGRVPHQTTLLPAEPAAGLAGASDRMLTVLAGVLPRVLAGLAAVLDDPAYNLVVHAGPVGDPAADAWYRWHITIYPRVTTIGGLEIATGVAVNPSTPEQTAAILRAQLADGGGNRGDRDGGGNGGNGGNGGDGGDGDGGDDRGGDGRDRGDPR